MSGGAHLASTGRGGAGNFHESTKSPKVQPEDLQTPTLKTGMVTTGRGGSGNFKPNTDPVETRALQDVEPVARRDSHGALHSGRGGAGNVFKGDEAEQAMKAANENAVAEDKEEPHKGLAAKGKALFGIGKKD